MISDKKVKKMIEQIKDCYFESSEEYPDVNAVILELLLDIRNGLKTKKCSKIKTDPLKLKNDDILVGGK